MIFNWAKPSQLKHAGVLGMNSRNHAYVLKYNPRRLYPRVDDKTFTKLLAAKHHVSTATMIGLVKCQFEVKDIPNLVRNHQSFVIKPAHGSGGRGILVIKSHEGDVYRKNDGVSLDFKEIYRHVSNLLSGLYSLGGQPDTAIIEECIQFTDVFDGFSFQGVPDVRLIVFQGFPVMAMIRLSTKASDGKANLHQGAVGVGLSLKDGTALHAVQFGQVITHHPDTGRELATLKVPYWDQHLKLAAACQPMCGLGYFGADIALDQNRGPLLLELNARPGLAIQIANQAGLAERLHLIESLELKDYSDDAAKIAFSQQHFK